ncbi:MAG: dehydrogenase [Pelagibacterales bacterium]|nr:dehydrogenase [Pelagibacterales bacterium]OUU62970.1 MAG: hypothetical protein CBC22_02735 [Alphaproteobacteria bacterium TMED62]|tara:strand:- start:12568 stop:14628 length:2061 start_codon:yes stop_codon:yes gene_type:complete
MKLLSTSACPHDCPSTCTLDIHHDNKNIFKIKGNKENSYTKGVICSKVSRYQYRTHNKDRLVYPMQRVGNKGSSDFKRISWENALNIVCEKFLEINKNYGSEAIWPYFYAGTMGLLQRDGINRFRHEFNFSDQYSTICNTLPQAGWMAGVGSLMGPDPREVKHSKIIVMWGGNPASTQVNFMKHVQNARKNNNAFLIVIDPYLTKTAKIADLHIKLRPGTDGALACGIMKYLIENNKVDDQYIKKYTKGMNELNRHLVSKDKNWASKICGVEYDKIATLSKLISKYKKVFFRLGYGFTRHRNGSFNMHAVICIPTLLGAWKTQGGGAFYNNGGIYNIDKSLIEGLNFKNHDIRVLDQSRIGSILTGNKEALKYGPAVKGLLIQNTNPLVIAPETSLVRKGFMRKDLFICVHEQFLTETAKYADIILPATSFVEHNDIYIAGGHQHLTLGPKLIDELGECWSNHKLINTLSKKMGATKKEFSYSEEDLIDKTLKLSLLGNLKELRLKKFIDLQPNFQESHFIKGFGHKDKKFHLTAEWKSNDKNFNNKFKLPDHYDLIENASKEYPFKLITAPAHNFLNSSFTEVLASRKIENMPKIKIHPEDMKRLNISDNEIVEIGNIRAKLKIHTEIFEGLLQGTVVVEGVWPNEYFIEGLGINALIGSDSPEPFGGAVFHDCAIWIKKLSYQV